jgi:hypothetical protein
MTCQRCNSARVAHICAKCSDLCCFQNEWGYVPGNAGIGGGDYVEFDYCLECGQIQGKFPLPLMESEESC